MNPVNCIVCEKELLDIGSGSQNHPSGANIFQAYGIYGSTVFDPLDGTFLEINICDSCIVERANKNMVLTGRRDAARGVIPLKIWKSDND